MAAHQTSSKHAADLLEPPKEHQERKRARTHLHGPEVKQDGSPASFAGSLGSVYAYDDVVGATADAVSSIAPWGQIELDADV
jgi:hypothetical protein